MEKDIIELLNEEISDELKRLGEVEVNTDQHKALVESVTKLMDKKIEIEKIERDSKARDQEHELESKKLEQITNEKNDQIFKNAIAIAGIVVPSLLTVWGTFKTLKFEETGTITTIMGRGFVNKLIPKK